MGHSFVSSCSEVSAIPPLFCISSVHLVPWCFPFVLFLLALRHVDGSPLCLRRLSWPPFAAPFSSKFPLFPAPFLSALASRPLHPRVLAFFPHSSEGPLYSFIFLILRFSSLLSLGRERNWFNSFPLFLVKMCLIIDSLT